MPFSSLFTPKEFRDVQQGELFDFKTHTGVATGIAIEAPDQAIVVAVLKHAENRAPHYVSLPRSGLVVASYGSAWKMRPLSQHLDSHKSGYVKEISGCVAVGVMGPIMFLRSVTNDQNDIWINIDECAIISESTQSAVFVDNWEVSVDAPGGLFADRHVLVKYSKPE